MARARNIKPGFFRNADLADCSITGRLLFIGLWTLADREGRLEDRPKYIKFELFPSDNIDIDAELDDLERHGFIARYAHSDGCFIQVVNFAKHQNPHVKEAPSTIPAPGEPGASTGQAEEREVPSGLNPESGFLNPESPPTPSEGDAPNGAKPELTLMDGGKGKPKRPRQKYPADFETFWEAYPSGHGNKQRAFTEWRKIKPDAELFTKIMAGLDAWKQCRRWRDGFIKAAETWLKDAWWENDPPGVNVHPIRKSLDINDYAPDEWPSLAYGPATTPEERELSRQAAERLMG